MKLIRNTFVLVAPDCPVSESVVPKSKTNQKPSIHVLQYELLSQHPYHYDLEDLIYEVHIRHKGYTEEEIDEKGHEIKDELFKKSHPCMRASTLMKKYGWGVHYNEYGKLALYPMESEEYQRFSRHGDEQVRVEFAMRNKRK